MRPGTRNKQHVCAFVRACTQSASAGRTVPIMHAGRLAATAARAHRVAPRACTRQCVSVCVRVCRLIYFNIFGVIKSEKDRSLNNPITSPECRGRRRRR